MYFWKIEKLKEDIREGTLSEKDRFSYMFLSSIITVLLMVLLRYTPIEQPNIWDVIDSTLYVLMSIIGMLFAYRANGGSNGTDFLGKYFSISFVLMIRLFILFLLIAIVLFFYHLFTFDEDEIITTTLFEIVLASLWTAIFYYRLYVHISDVKNTTLNN